MKDSLTGSLSLTVTIIIRTPRPRLWAWPFSAMCGCIAGVQQGERSVWSSEKSAEHRVQGYGRRTPSARPSVCNVGLGTCGARGMQAYGVHGCSVEGMKRRVTSVGRWARGCRGRRMLCTRLGEDREGVAEWAGGVAVFGGRTFFAARLSARLGPPAGPPACHVSQTARERCALRKRYVESPTRLCEEETGEGVYGWIGREDSGATGEVGGERPSMGPKLKDEAGFADAGAAAACANAHAFRHTRVCPLRLRRPTHIHHTETQTPHRHRHHTDRQGSRRRTAARRTAARSQQQHRHWQAQRGPNR